LEDRADEGLDYAPVGMRFVNPREGPSGWIRLSKGIGFAAHGHGDMPLFFDKQSLGLEN
jgi:hypothetical protein